MKNLALVGTSTTEIFPNSTFSILVPSVVSFDPILDMEVLLCCSYEIRGKIYIKVPLKMSCGSTFWFCGRAGGMPF